MAQGRFPVTSAEEMRGFDFENGSTNDAVRYHLASRLGDYGKGRGELNASQWMAEFEAAYGIRARTRNLVTQEYIAMALADYQRSQVFVDTPWKAYVQGDLGALETPAKRGALLFYRSAAQAAATVQAAMWATSSPTRSSMRWPCLKLGRARTMASLGTMTLAAIGRQAISGISTLFARHRCSMSASPARMATAAPMQPWKGSCAIISTQSWRWQPTT
ncbi:MAG: hypothetical protein HC802_14560 [Caldilineaceae bacterium]|nr:hypothetical protein [Caldilineaceae bacterium]